MKAHVVCRNDSIILVVLNDEERAEAEKEEMAKSHYERVKQLWTSYEEYRNQYYWHLHTVSVLQ